MIPALTPAVQQFDPEPPNTERPGWHTQAACRTLNPNIFYPERGTPTGEAKQVCADCPVQPACLMFALDHHEMFGIWGGKSERQRRDLRRVRRLAS